MMVSEIDNERNTDHGGLDCQRLLRRIEYSVNESQIVFGYACEMTNHMHRRKLICDCLGRRILSSPDRIKDGHHQSAHRKDICTK